jgi:hypothetical protein
VTFAGQIHVVLVGLVKLLVRPASVLETLMVSVAVPTPPSALIALIITELLAAWVGVPLIRPELASRLRPLGNPLAPKLTGLPLAVI